MYTELNDIGVHFFLSSGNKFLLVHFRINHNLIYICLRGFFVSVLNLYFSVPQWSDGNSHHREALNHSMAIEVKSLADGERSTSPNNESAHTKICREIEFSLPVS